MEAAGLFAGLLTLNWILYLWETFLSWRQYCVHRDTVERPEAVKEIIEEDAYVKARAYKIDKHRFALATGIFSQLETTVILCYGILPSIWQFSSTYPAPSVVFFVVSTVLETVVSLPFNLYDTFVIEQAHGFNKQTVGFYFTDQAKKLLLTFVLGSPILLAVEWIIANGGPYFFVYVWIFLSIVILLLLTIYPEFIAPLFDKYIPLPEGELKVAIEALAARVNYPLTKLYVVHGSKRSAHSNAYMYGFWKNKRIVLYDTLLSGEELERVVKECGVEEEEQKKILAEDRGMGREEVVAVLGHELGHWDHGHTLANLVITELNLLFMLAVFGYFYKWDLLYKAFGFDSTPSGAVVGLILVFQYIMALYNQILGTAMNMFTRLLEFQADAYAVKLGYGDQLVAALTKLGKDNLSLPVDDWLYSACNHSHPPIPERSRAIRQAMGNLKKTE